MAADQLKISSSRQASTVLMANANYLAGHHHNIEIAIANAAPQAFLPVREMGSLQPRFSKHSVWGARPNLSGSIFPDFCLEQPELQSIIGDQVSQEVQDRILMAVRQTHTKNLEKVQLWDSKVRSLYLAALGLVNDGVETLRGYWGIQTALDVRQ